MMIRPTIRRVKRSAAYRTKRNASLVSRLITSPLRSLPDFLVIGAQRGGTTSFYNYLVQHSGVVPAFEKEVHFFDGDYDRGTLWYRGRFPTEAYKRRAERAGDPKIVTGEATPYYLFHPLAPARARLVVPRAKLIVLLRNPVERAYSHYHLERRYGLEDLSFEEAIEREPERLAGEEEKMLADKSYRSFEHRHHSYLSRGIYMDQLQRWRNFFSEEQFLALSSEDFYANPPAVIAQASDFLGLLAMELGEYKKHNEGRYPKVDATTRERLVDYFRPHNERLYEYLGRDLGWDR